MKNNDEDLRKPESTVLAASLMSLLGIIIFTIGLMLVTSLLVYLYAKVINFDVKMTNEKLFEEVARIPDYFSNAISYSICKIVLRGVSMPLIFFLAIKDRFKGSYMNRIDLKKFKAILFMYAFVFSILYGGLHYKVYVDLQEMYVNNNIVIQDAHLDENGYYDLAVRNFNKVPKIALIVFAISGVVTVYVAVSTAEAMNNKYLDKLMRQNYLYNNAVR